MMFLYSGSVNMFALKTDRDMVLKSKVIMDIPKGQHFIYADSNQ